MRVFIVDDEPAILDLYRDVLHECGMEVAGAACNGAEAVQHYAVLDPKPDLVIMDHRMPVMSGLDATRNILKIHPQARIVFVSADLNVAGRARALGAMAFHKKPFPVDRFIHMLEHFRDTL